MNYSSQIPIGIAGPLPITGQHQTGTFFAPLATTEPTLVASCSRGCKAFAAGGGVRVRALKSELSRAPRFRFDTVDDALVFLDTIPSLEPRMRSVVATTSRFAKLIRVTPHIISTDVHLKMAYDTGDAAGQNMVTIATQAACEDLLQTHQERFNVVEFAIEGQMSSDKKLSTSQILEPRGTQVVAWGTVSDATCRSVLGLPAETLHLGIQRMAAAAMRNSMLGNSINASNIIAAMFISCGQDAASVLESGWAQLTSSYDSETQVVTLGLFLASLLVGSVGGGTMYPTQRESLEMIGCTGPGKKLALAETIAAFALALDLSTMSAVANDTFTTSHERLARKAKI